MAIIHMIPLTLIFFACSKGRWPQSIGFHHNCGAKTSQRLRRNENDYVSCLRDSSAICQGLFDYQAVEHYCGLVIDLYEYMSSADISCTCSNP
jgi:hypothetical protein